MSEKAIDFTVDKTIGLITLNRQKTLNALTFDMIQSMTEQLLAWRDDEAIKMVVIQAVPGRAFCAGGDIRYIYDVGHEKHDVSADYFWHEYRLNYLIASYPKPYISFLDGITMGGGVGISLHGQYPVATENLLFAMPETGIGFFPDIGSSAILLHAPGEISTYLALTGARLNAADAKYCGLLEYVIQSNAWPEIYASLADCENIDGLLADKQVDLGEPPLALVKNKIDQHFAFDTITMILHSLEQDDCEWAQATLQTLRMKSPTSLKVTLQQMRLASRCDVAACLQMDYRLVSRFIHGHDFYEGIRALIVDKDKNPQWQPTALDQITEENIEQYFAPLADGELELI